jgi:U3 small nucleolar RNA-associated protein MPP10
MRSKYGSRSICKTNHLSPLWIHLHTFQETLLSGSSSVGRDITANGTADEEMGNESENGSEDSDYKPMTSSDSDNEMDGIRSTIEEEDNSNAHDSEDEDTSDDVYTNGGNALGSGGRLNTQSRGTQNFNDDSSDFTRNHSELDDEFFNLQEFNKCTDDIEEQEMKQQMEEDDIDNDADNDDDDIDLFAGNSYGA